MTSPRLLPTTILVVLAAVTGCAQHDDSALPARNWVAQGEAAHFESEHRLALGDVTGARAALNTAVTTPSPSGAAPADVRVVRQDLYFQLAQLELQHGTPQDAARWATAGLDLGTPAQSDAFTANLQIARGTALERAGDANGATRDYHAALVTTEALLEKSLGDEKAP